MVPTLFSHGTALYQCILYVEGSPNPDKVYMEGARSSLTLKADRAKQLDKKLCMDNFSRETGSGSTYSEASGVQENS